MTETPPPDALDDLPSEFEEELDRSYLVELSRLQVELLAWQKAIMEQGLRMVVLFEGRDTAGKGGAILRFTQHLRPRSRRIVALGKPSEREQGQWFFQRYVAHLPAPGEIVFFDRSWYNRAVVEPVMGFCNEEQYERFIRQVVPFESMLVEDGIVLIKLWFSIDREVQQERLADRARNPLKRWKLSSVDGLAQQNWERFTHYKEVMFSRTSTATSPWVVIAGNTKKIARLESIRYVLSRVAYTPTGQPGLRLRPDPEVVHVLGADYQIGSAPAGGAPRSSEG